MKLKALVGRSKAKNQDSATGFYPHAGLLSTFQYLTRYPTTETNRNRLRARMYYQHFLGVDVLELAARVSDAAAVTAKYKVPTMQASECVVCHKTLDPVAGLFQDYWRFDATRASTASGRAGGSRTCSAAGFEGEDLPAAERWRALQWLGERTAKDPRFAVAMVEHVYYILTGRKVLLPPKDLEDPLYPAKLRAYQEQRRQIEAIAARFAEVRVQPQDRVQGLDRVRLLPGRRAGDRGQGPEAAGGTGRRRAGADALPGAGRAEGGGRTSAPKWGRHLPLDLLRRRASGPARRRPARPAASGPSARSPARRPGRRRTPTHSLNAVLRLNPTSRTGRRSRSTSRRCSWYARRFAREERVVQVLRRQQHLAAGQDVVDVLDHRDREPRVLRRPLAEPLQRPPALGRPAGPRPRSRRPNMSLNQPPLRLP